MVQTRGPATTGYLSFSIVLVHRRSAMETILGGDAPTKLSAKKNIRGASSAKWQALKAGVG